MDKQVGFAFRFEGYVKAYKRKHFCQLEKCKENPSPIEGNRLNLQLRTKGLQAGPGCRVDPLRANPNRVLCRVVARTQGDVLARQRRSPTSGPRPSNPVRLVSDRHCPFQRTSFLPPRAFFIRIESDNVFYAPQKKLIKRGKRGRFYNLQSNQNMDKLKVLSRNLLRKNLSSSFRNTCYFLTD